MTEKVKLVKLSAEQIALAKDTNGGRKHITHAVVCGNYGQLFGTEKQCRKYYTAWSKIFPRLFSGGEEVDDFDLESFETTPELVMVLIDAHDPLVKAASVQQIADMSRPSQQRPAKKKGFWAKLFGV
ncbi:hypothetical protein [Oceanisphaera sp.]|uniref:hypothetical protein n=1 Tax=Oceanisphaera sp. TaxID=1929979 RepID=UPI003A94CFFB